MDQIIKLMEQSRNNQLNLFRLPPSMPSISLIPQQPQIQPPPPPPTPPPKPEPVKIQQINPLELENNNFKSIISQQDLLNQDLIKKYNELKGVYDQMLIDLKLNNDKFNKLNNDFINLKDYSNIITIGNRTADDNLNIALNDTKNKNEMITKQYIETTKKSRTTYNDLLKENELLENKKNYLKDTYTTDDQKVSYEINKNDYLINLRFYFFIIFYILLFIYIVFIFYFKNDGSPIFFKIIIIFLIGIYPFVINYIEEYAIKIFKLLYYIIQGEPYTN